MSALRMSTYTKNSRLDLLDDGLHVGPVLRVPLLHRQDRQLLDQRPRVERELSQTICIIRSERVNGRLRWRLKLSLVRCRGRGLRWGVVSAWPSSRSWSWRIGLTRGLLATSPHHSVDLIRGEVEGWVIDGARSSE